MQQQRLNQQQLTFALVARCDLSQSDAGNTLARWSTLYHERLRGIRQILNHHPTDASLTWPGVDHGDYMRSSQWLSNFALLQRHQLSFDAQVNPHQLIDLAHLASQFPEVPIVLNHIGCPRLTRLAQTADEQQQLRLWRDGMQALAQRRSVSVKLSQFPFVCSSFANEQRAQQFVSSLVADVLQWFSAERCMTGSNYPVDKADDAMPMQILDVVRHAVGDDERRLREVFHDSAVRFYRMS
jgi:predicted TIM-barrel fold metal-dependent hydrolase